MPAPERVRGDDRSEAAGPLCRTTRGKKETRTPLPLPLCCLANFGDRVDHLFDRQITHSGIDGQRKAPLELLLRHGAVSAAVAVCLLVERVKIQWNEMHARSNSTFHEFAHELVSIDPQTLLLQPKDVQVPGRIAAGFD